jgi:hypothetical protein
MVPPTASAGALISRTPSATVPCAAQYATATSGAPTTALRIAVWRALVGTNAARSTSKYVSTKLAATSGAKTASAAIKR